MVVGLNLIGGEENTPQWEHTFDVPYLDAEWDGISLSKRGLDRHFGRTRVARNYQVGNKWAKRPVRNERQVSIATLEDLKLIAEQAELTDLLGERGIDIGGFMSLALPVNVVISGTAKLSEQLGPGTKLFFGGEDTGAILDISEAHLPCSKPANAIARSLNLAPEEIKDRFKEVARARRGHMASVYSPGRIALEDSVDVQLPIDHRTTRADWRP